MYTGTIRSASASRSAAARCSASLPVLDALSARIVPTTAASTANASTPRIPNGPSTMSALLSHRRCNPLPPLPISRACSSRHSSRPSRPPDAVAAGNEMVEPALIPTHEADIQCRESSVAAAAIDPDRSTSRYRYDEHMVIPASVMAEPKSTGGEPLQKSVLFGPGNLTALHSPQKRLVIGV